MANERATLYLIDGYNLIFRAFFALPQLSNSRGMPTNAIFGFTRMLLKLLKDERPAMIAVVFDSPKKTFRDDLFQDYKANRAAMPNDLSVQIPYIQRAVDAFRISTLTVDGVEADDVIGTLATRAAKRDVNTVIVTGDKDFMQLVGPRVSLLDTMHDKRTGLREVRERFGVEPPALIDIMALTGDAIDNVKGVPGVGEKTASALIQKFGNLDKLLASLDHLDDAGIRGAKRLAGLIAEHRGAVELARKLVRIDTDVQLTVAPESLNWPGIDQAGATGLMRELEFGSILEELAPSQARLPETSGEERLVEKNDVAAALKELARASRIALDLEESDGKPARLKLKAAERDETLILDASLIRDAAPFIGSAVPPKSCHDLKRHLRKLPKFGAQLRGVDFDTMLAGFLVNPGRPEPSLDALYHEHLAPLGGRTSSASEPEIVEALRDVLQARLKKDELEAQFRDIEMPVAAILAEMEATGIGVDAAALRTISAEFGAELERLERECIEVAGHPFNLNSPIQLRDVLFNELKLKAKGIKRTKSGPSTDVDALTKLAAEHPLPAKILEYRALAKLKSTYSDALPTLIDPASGRIHTEFHQALTATGRLSSTDPNLQNIPTRTEVGRRIRRAFVAGAAKVLLSADYSQIELRVLAHLSADPTLVDAFRRGEDIHARTAAEVLGISRDAIDSEARRLAKVINFGIIYGMGPSRLASELGITLKESSDYIRRYFERLPAVRSHLDQSLLKARERGFVTTMFGRRRYLPELSSPEGGARAQAERIAINTPIQGSAADLIKLAMVRVHDAILAKGLAARIVLQVHDELLLEVSLIDLDATCDLVRTGMERVSELNVPLKVDLKWGPNWAELRGQPTPTSRATLTDG